jgi:cytochrome c oxidase cbb3-type subunit 3
MTPTGATSPASEPEPARAPATATAAATPASTAAAPASGPRVLDHSYDGIQEFDNPLPGWWSAIFIGSIVFAVAYWFWFHAGGPGRSELEEFAIARKVYDDDRASEQAAVGTASEGTLAMRASDPGSVENGRAVFQKYCQSCHTPDGRGLVGPNLTDEFQKHGHDRVAIFTTVSKGVDGTAMIAWTETLRGSELLDVVAFVITLRGGNIAGGKAPEGDPVGPFPSPP